MSTASTIPWLPTTSEMEAADVSIAEQVAMMLHAERQVLVVASGRDPGRLSGFLADLTHALSHGETVLRIKAAIEPTELYPLLAGQLGLPPTKQQDGQIAVQVGERLSAPARNGHYVLLCEGAHLYDNGLLEVIRQLSNYPINIVLCGRPLLLRRLQGRVLRSLRQRINYRLSLDEVSTTGYTKPMLIALSVILLVYLGLRMTVWRPAESTLAGPVHSGAQTQLAAPAAHPDAAVEKIRPAFESKVTPVAAPVPGPSAPAEAELALRWETELHAQSAR